MGVNCELESVLHASHHEGGPGAIEVGGEHGGGDKGRGGDDGRGSEQVSEEVCVEEQRRRGRNIAGGHSSPVFWGLSHLSQDVLWGPPSLFGTGRCEVYSESPTLC